MGACSCPHPLSSVSSQPVCFQGLSFVSANSWDFLLLGPAWHCSLSVRLPAFFSPGPGDLLRLTFATASGLVWAMVWGTLRQRPCCPSAQLDAGVGGCVGTNGEGFVVVRGTSSRRVFARHPGPQARKASPACGVLCWRGGTWGSSGSRKVGVRSPQALPPPPRCWPAHSVSAVPPSSPFAKLLQLG